MISSLSARQQVTRRAVLISAAILPVSTVQAREVDPAHHAPNGHNWRKLNDGEKFLFVVAFREGISAFSSALDDLERAAETKVVHKNVLEMFSASEVTLDDLVREISRFYEEPANASIPVAVMYPLSCLLFKGMMPDDVQHHLSELRKTYSSAQ